MAKKRKYGHRDGFPRYFKADYELQQKIGTGTIDPALIAKVQQYMDNVPIDVTPDLRQMLDDIAMNLAEAKRTTYGREDFLPQIIKPLMNIKSTSGMFRELMLCRVSAFMLAFLEDVKRLDDNAAEILGAYVKVGRTLLDLKIREETNPHGLVFLDEIRKAAKRYYDRQAAAIKG